MCPRCGVEVVQKTGRGRPSIWCSASCRRMAHLERKAAPAVSVVEIRREPGPQKPPSAAEAVQIVLDSPKAVENVLKALGDAAVAGTIPAHARDRLAYSARQAAAAFGNPR